MNQHSGPLVSLLSNGAKKEGGGGRRNEETREGCGTSCIQRRFSLVAERYKDTMRVKLLGGWVWGGVNCRFQNLQSAVGSLDLILITKVGVLQSQ